MNSFVKIFDYDADLDDWAQRGDKLKDDSGAYLQSFGQDISMSASGNRFATNSPDDYLYGGRGSVYVFDSDGASWSSPFTLRS